MTITKIDLAITIATLIFIAVGSWSSGYLTGKHSPCTQVESIDIKPIP